MSLNALITNPTTYNPATGKLTILSIPGDDVETVNNPPSAIGVNMVDNTDPHNPVIYSLLGGADIGVSAPDVNGDVEISYIGLPPNSVMNNLGTGEPVLTTTTTGTLPVNSPRDFKTLVAGTNISLIGTADEITISSSYANSAHASSFRLEIDPSTDVDPITGGLLIPANPTVGAQFNLPWITTSSLGICSAYNNNEIDPVSGLPDFDFTNIAWPNGVIKFNNAGKFRLTFNCFVLGDFDPAETKTIQIQKNGDAIYSAPAAGSFSNQTGVTLPGTLTWPLAWSFYGGGNVQIEAGDEIVLRCVLNNTTNANVFTLYNNFSCERLDAAISGLLGPQGPPGAVNSVVNDPITGAGLYELIENPGSNAIITVKNIKAGTDISIVDNGTDLEISSTGSGGTITMNNLIPGPVAGSENVLTNPGTASSFDFRAITEGAGIQITSDADDVLVQQRAMQPSTLGGIYGNQNDDSNIIGNNNNAIIGTNQNSNVIGSDLGLFTPQDTNMMVTYDNFSGIAGSSYVNSNIIVSGTGSNILGSSNTNVIANGLISPSTVLTNSIYIGDLNDTIPATNSICINNNVNGNAITMATNSVYMGTGNNIINVSTGECHFDFDCPAWFYHNLTNSIPAGNNILYYDPVLQQIYYNTITVPNSNLANLGAGNGIVSNTGSLPVTTTRNFKSLLAGTNITLTPTANDITISAVAGSDTNIYNTSGTLTANRTMTMGGFNLNMTGSGGFNVRLSGAVNIGDSSTTTVTIGRSGQALSIGSSTISALNLVSATSTDILYFNTGTGAITHSPISALSKSYANITYPAFAGYTLGVVNVYTANATVTGSLVQASGDFALDAGTYNLVFSGTSGTLFSASCNICFSDTTGPGTQTIGVRINVNGTSLTESTNQYHYSGNNPLFVPSTPTIISLNNGDTIGFSMVYLTAGTPVLNVVKAGIVLTQI